MVTGLRRQSLTSASRLFRFDESLARPGPILFPPPSITTTAFGPVTIKRGSGFVAFLIGGVPKWVVDVRRFGGNPALSVQLSSNNTSMQVGLTNARLPGTDVPADFTLALTLIHRGVVTFVRMTLKLSYGSFVFTGNFVAWLNGAVQATSPV